MRVKRSFLLLAYLVFFYSDHAQSSIGEHHIVTLVFHNKVGATDLYIDSTYTNPFGEIYTIKKLKYYISNIQIANEDSKKSESFPGKYFLIDAEEEDSKIISLLTSVDHITSLHFLIGVDSVQNTSGIQSGVLDPAKGMFWVWNTGYIMAKLEGVSNVANVPGHYFTYDIGGYKPGENTAREIILNISSAPVAKTDTLNVLVDINKWFDAVHNISINANPLCHLPGTLAVQIADNFSTMFSIAPGKK